MGLTSFTMSVHCQIRILGVGMIPKLASKVMVGIGNCIGGNYIRLLYQIGLIQFNMID